MDPAGTLRFGILGAAKIAPMALVQPARDVPGVAVVAVAAREPERARAFAAKHGIACAAADYEALLAMPEVDVVYNALPTALHARWTLRALRAGKHVLCEKPFASNAREAEQMVAEAETAGRRLVEAFHWRYHPVAARILAICGGGELGRIVRLEARFSAPIRDRSDIRWDLALGGGASMDLGCYPVHWCRTVMGSEPEVVAAKAREGPPRVDVEMEAELRFPRDARAGGAPVPARVHCSMDGDAPFEATLDVIGSEGALHVRNPLAPQLGHRIELRRGGETRAETAPGRSTYHHQLEAVARALREGAPLPTGGADAIANLRVLDGVYRASGLGPRGE
jgi:predicted dehydrogenase